MSTIKDGGLAFPAHPEIGMPDRMGMTLREYAAIKLRVPESGTDWLDDMIRQSMRDELAARAMQGLIASNDAGAGDRLDGLPEYAWQIADAALRARDQEPS